MATPAKSTRAFNLTPLPRLSNSNGPRSRGPSGRLGLFLLVLLALAGCDGPTTTTEVPDPLQLSQSGSDLTIRIISGDGETVAPGETIRNVEVEVSDESGESAKTFVFWAVTSGDGSTQHAVSRTNGRGRARVHWTTGPEPGTQTLQAGVADDATVTFTATVVGEDAESDEESDPEGEDDEVDEGEGEDPDDEEPDDGEPDDEEAGTLEVSPGNLTMAAIGAEEQLQVVARDADGSALASPGVTWSSSDRSIVTVNEEGKVISVAAGAAMVVATAACCSPDTVSVEVEQSIRSVEVSPASARVAAGETVRLEAEALDSNGHPVLEATFDWSSDDRSVATVDQNGLATGVAEGSAGITATAGGVSDEATVEVFVDAGPGPSSDGIWIDPSDLARLPTSGAAWSNVKKAADTNLSGGVLTDRDDHNVRVMAAALVAARLNDNGYRARVRDALMDLVNAPLSTDDGLAVNRRLVAYVVAADLIGLSSFDGRADGDFRSWLERVRTTTFQSGGGGTIAEYHERRPNNYGTMAGASRMATAVYLGDTAELERAARVFRGWLGDRSAYSGFKFGSDLSWQADERSPVGINPRGATRNGRNIDGVLPDDQRRCGSLGDDPWPCTTNYSYGGLAGALAQAQILHQQGYDAFRWGDRAILRAMTWLHEVADQSADGDRQWQPHLVNGIYGTGFPAPDAASPGKNVGWADWTH